MIRTIFKIKYGFKDFQHHMGISSNTTIMGMFRRTFRKHPKIAKALKTITIMGSLYFVMMNFIPGSNLPFQKSIKISVFSLYQLDHIVHRYSLRLGVIIFSILTLKHILLESIRSFLQLSIGKSLISSLLPLLWRKLGKYMNWRRNRWPKMCFGI